MAVSAGMILVAILGLVGLGVVIVGIVLVVWAIANDRKQ
jgi:hypothetical protein